MDDRAEFFRRVQSTICRTLRVPPEAVGPGTSMASLPEWDSLRYLQVVTALEEEFGVRFRRAELRELRSVPRILEVLSGLLGEASA